MSHAANRRSALIAAATSTLAASGCPATGSNAESVASYIVERSKEWTHAYSTGNSEVMEPILAADFVSTSPRGRKSGKRAAIESARSGPSVFESAQAGPLEVRVFGATALAFGGDLLVLKNAPARAVATAWTDVWLLRRGEWLAIASHESEVGTGTGA